MDSISQEERVQLALKAFNDGRNDTPCSLTFISSLQASLGKGESFLALRTIQRFGSVASWALLFSWPVL